MCRPPEVAIPMAIPTAVDVRVTPDAERIALDFSL